MFIESDPNFFFHNGDTNQF
jgi:hypothetical protein